jgi:Fungal chitosanase of glycosyl hydrolase group 75
MKLPLDLLLTIDGVPIFTGYNGGYVAFISDLSICNDGSGPAHGDPDYQRQTAYNPYLNADKDRYIVTPPQVRKMVPPVVLGCQGRVTNLAKPKQWSWGVVGDVGPADKTGEAAYCLAKILNPRITHNAGDDVVIYLYEMWPGIPAVVGRTKYKLQAA